MNIQGLTPCWVFSSCWAFRLESAAAVERRFSSRKPPPPPLYRYTHPSGNDRRKEQNVRRAFFFPTLYCVDGCVVFYVSISDFSGHSSDLCPRRSCWTLSSLQHPRATRSRKIIGPLLAFVLNETVTDFNVL